MILHSKSQKFPACGRLNQICCIRIPPLVSDPGETRGGILMGGGILKWNTPDLKIHQTHQNAFVVVYCREQICVV